mmetsp:Transcript_19550/g.26836  ORF Transcript_19550/g.26836 Transcript_19550/m.26836 type:complete len:468 (-) Transcript_19550:62-1465(-)
MARLFSKKVQRNAFLAAFTVVLLSLLDPPPLPQSLQRRQALSAQDEAVMGDVYDFVDDADTAVYWHIPKASGSSMKGYYGCLGLVEATQMGITEGHDTDESLEVWDHPHGPKFLNVDTTREDGILHAKQLGLAQSGLADVVFTEYPAIATQMFTTKHQARFFTLLRHPIERSVSLFYYRQIAKWEKHDGVYKPDLAGLELEEYARKRINSRDNGGFMVSLLLNKRRTEPLTDDDLQKAKEILRTKFVVGLTSRMEESVQRFDNYFGWHDVNDEEGKKQRREECLDLYIRQKTGGGENKSNKNTYKHVEEGSEAWKLWAKFHYFDMQLYEFAVQLFEDQADLLGVHAWEDYLEEQQQQQQIMDVVPVVENVPVESIVPGEGRTPPENNVPVESRVSGEGNVPPESNVPAANVVATENNVPVENNVPAENSVPIEENNVPAKNIDIPAQNAVSAEVNIADNQNVPMQSA